MSKVTRSVEISAPVERVFNYYARPEHIAKTFPQEVKIKVVPIKITEGFGLGTIFRISGEFGGRPLEWDNETVAYEKNNITVRFEELGENSTRLTFDVDYDLGYGVFGKALDKMKIKKEVEMGLERSCATVKQSVEAGKSVEEITASAS